MMVQTVAFEVVGIPSQLLGEAVVSNPWGGIDYGIDSDLTSALPCAVALYADRQRTDP